MINKYAPIVPYVGMGGFQLGMTKEEAEQVLERPLGEGELVHAGAWCRYDIDDILTLAIDHKSGRVVCLETKAGYRGKLFGRIGTDTKEEELLDLEPTLKYDDFEEFYESVEKGIQIEISLPDEKATWITIWQKDL